MIPVPLSKTVDDQISSRICFIKSLAILLLGLAPVPAGWAGARSVKDSLRSSELNRADSEAAAGGYYEGLIGGGDGPQGARGELAMALLGKPTDWGRFHAANVTQRLPDGDFLEFFLKPNLNLRLFGHPFTTNRHGMRDRDYAIEKPEGVYRIAVLGSSIDMGWGISIEDTYVTCLEKWLNAHAEKLRVNRKFEVLNFGVAAYSPLQRLEYYRRKARDFRPDLIIYSATMLDQRLMEIHLGDVFAERGDLTYDFLSETLRFAKVTKHDLEVDSSGRLPRKEIIRKKLQPFYWTIYDKTLGTLASDCRSDGAELVCVSIPRVGKIDAPKARAESVAMFEGIGAHNAIPVFDLSDTFDNQDPELFEIAAWDDHPNALGHKRLFFGISRAIVNHQPTYSRLFPGAVSPKMEELQRLPNP